MARLWICKLQMFRMVQIAFSSSIPQAVYP